MIATLTIQPLTEHGSQTGNIVGSCEVEFTSQDASDAANEIGCTVVEGMLRSLRDDPDLTAFDLTIEVQVEPEDLGKRAWIIEEHTTHRVVASSLAEAEAIYADKGGELLTADAPHIYEQE